jgi:GNAT superfamily N-acetyltransferase
MNKTETLAIFDREQRRDDVSHESRREVTPYVVRHVPRHAGARWGWIVYSQLNGADVDAVIEEQVAYYTALGFNFEWKWYSHDEPFDLPERLISHGFEPEDPESLMVLDLHAAPPALWQTSADAVRRITDQAGLSDVMAVENAVWGDSSHDWIAVELAQEMEAGPDRISVYCAYVDNAPASTAWIRFHPGTHFASLWGGATSALFRRQGLYTALLAVRGREARDKGYRFLTVDASEMSRPILEKHGFEKIATTTPYKYRLPGAGTT